MRSAVRNARSQGYAAGSRAQKPTLALPPLSPERAPATVPSGTRRVAPPAAIADLPTVEATSELAGVLAIRGGPGGVGGIATVDPSGSTTAWSTASAGTTAGQ